MAVVRIDDLPCGFEILVLEEIAAVEVCAPVVVPCVPVVPPVTVCVAPVAVG